MELTQIKTLLHIVAADAAAWGFTAAAAAAPPSSATIAAGTSSCT